MICYTRPFTSLSITYDILWPHLILMIVDASRIPSRYTDSSNYNFNGMIISAVLTMSDCTKKNYRKRVWFQLIDFEGLEFISGQLFVTFKTKKIDKILSKRKNRN